MSVIVSAFLALFPTKNVAVIVFDDASAQEYMLIDALRLQLVLR